MNDLSTAHAVAGVVAAGIALVAWLGDRRRMRRSNPDDVGFVPWTAVFFWALLAACVLLGLAAREWLGG
jgi:hypothetical protein